MSPLDGIQVSRAWARGRRTHTARAASDVASCPSAGYGFGNVQDRGDPSMKLDSRAHRTVCDRRQTPRLGRARHASRTLAITFCAAGLLSCASDSKDTETASSGANKGNDAGPSNTDERDPSPTRDGKDVPSKPSPNTDDDATDDSQAADDDATDDSQAADDDTDDAAQVTDDDNTDDSTGTDVSDDASTDDAAPAPTDAQAPGDANSPGDAKPDAPDVPAQPHNPLANPEAGPPAGNPDGNCDVPSEGALEDASSPDHVVGTGSKDSCTADAFIDAVAAGGVITFDCGPDPVTIVLDRPAKVFNDASDDIVIDGGGLVTLSGGGTTRILYMNTCDEAQHWTTSHCQDQETPRLTVQNITFADANSKNEAEYDGGGAIWARGGQVKIVNSRFFNNVCADEGPDVGGAGVRVFSQFEGRPVYVVNSTFGGAEGYGNTCSNGGGISSIGVSWTIINSLFTHNHAIGNGGNPAEDNTPGGGSGGAIYNDGATMTLSVCGTRIEDNQVKAFGSGIFFVSNNHDGTVVIKDSVVRNNTGGGWNVLPGISMHDDTKTDIENSTIE